MRHRIAAALEARRIRRLLTPPKFVRARKLARDSWINVFELAAVCLALYGVAMIYEPAAFILGGVVLIVALEFAGRSSAPNTVQHRRRASR